ncbi:hypothetical protein PYJP_00880 [Pyrofollis japonicus]|nr:hypothetical protein PYJP_00880 [Pyrofollis japonicus]
MTTIVVGLAVSASAMIPPSPLVREGDEIHYTITCSKDSSSVVIDLALVAKDVEFAPPGSSSTFSYKMVARAEIVDVGTSNNMDDLPCQDFVRELGFLSMQDLEQLLRDHRVAVTVTNLGERDAWFLVDKGFEGSLNIGGDAGAQPGARSLVVVCSPLKRLAIVYDAQSRLVTYMYFEDPKEGSSCTVSLHSTTLQVAPGTVLDRESMESYKAATKACKTIPNGYIIGSSGTSTVQQLVVATKTVTSTTTLWKTVTTTTTVTEQPVTEETVPNESSARLGYARVALVAALALLAILVIGSRHARRERA